MDSKTYCAILSRPNDYAWIGSECVLGPVRRVVLRFRGLGDGGLKSAPDEEDKALGAAGSLCITPYCGPWSWSNDKAVALADAVLDAVFQHMPLRPDTPVISTGGSMGGLAALMFCVFSEHNVAACYANCPVCDLPFHATERPDLPRTMYDAFAHYSCGIDEALRLTSPLHGASRFPDIPYLILHGDHDSAVNKAAHSDKLVAALRAYGRRVEYIEMPGMEHCQIGDPNVAARALRFVCSFSAPHQ